MTQPPDPDSGWKGLSWLFFPLRWKWVHTLMGHTMIIDPKTVDPLDPKYGKVCSCGWKWD